MLNRAYTNYLVNVKGDRWLAQGFSNVVFSDRTARKRAVLERKVLAVGAAHRQHLPLPVSACGASSQSTHRLLSRAGCYELYWDRGARRSRQIDAGGGADRH